MFLFIYQRWYPALEELIRGYSAPIKLIPIQDFDHACLNFYHDLEGYSFDPAVAIEDYDGDGIADYVFQAYDDDSEYLMSFLSMDGLWNPYVIWESPKKDHSEFPRITFLRPRKAQIFKSNYQENDLDLKTGSIEVIYCEKASVLYYWDKGKFKEYTLSD